MASEEYKRKKRAYIGNYNKKTYRSVNVMFRVDSPEQMELFEWLHGKYSVAGFLKDIALEKMRAEKNKK